MPHFCKADEGPAGRLSELGSPCSNLNCLGRRRYYEELFEVNGKNWKLQTMFLSPLLSPAP